MRDEGLRRAPTGFLAIGLFLFFGALMAGLAGTTLLWRGSTLDRIWTLNPHAYTQLVPWGKKVGILFLLLSTALACAGFGWLRRRMWGWRLTVAIIATQVFGDAVNCATGDFYRGGTGLIIAGALLFYLLRGKVKATFLGNTP